MRVLVCVCASVCDYVCRVEYLCVGTYVRMFVKHSVYDILKTISYT